MLSKRLFLAGSFAILLLAPLWAQEKQEKKPALLKVLLPRDDAALTIEGKVTEKSGKERTFESPLLEVGGKYTVKGFSARNGNPMGFMKTLVFPDGKEVVFWFGDPNGN